MLRRAGLLRSQRGVKGGYLFARPPTVTVLEIVELLDGPVGRERHGRLRRGRRARPARSSRATTVADVVEREAREAGVAMYYI